MPDVLRPERGDAGEVLVAVGDELEQAGGDPRLHDADADAVADRDQARPSGDSSTASPGLTWASSGRLGEVRQVREAGLAGLLDEDADRGLGAGLGRDGLLAGLDQQHLAGGRCCARRCGSSGRARAPSGSARARRELAQLPERLGQAVLGLGVGAQLEQAAVGLGRLGPLGGGACAIACSASWRRRRVWPPGVWAAASISGKVTERSSFRSIFASRGLACRGGDTPNRRGRGHVFLAPGTWASNASGPRGPRSPRPEPQVPGDDHHRRAPRAGPVSQMKRGSRRRAGAAPWSASQR